MTRRTRREAGVALGIRPDWGRMRAEGDMYRLRYASPKPVAARLGDTYLWYMPLRYRFRNAFASAAMPAAQLSLFSAGGASNGSWPATPRIASHRGRA